MVHNYSKLKSNNVIRKTHFPRICLDNYGLATH